ncbi:conjugal transfer protein [Ectothiorhodospira haloalkaliphila]|uniref:Conjugal transfer protein n=1 Tax=Ectothiorhodospira haloalkaliphila TaxID=421628 RepID=W8KT03_9GAMM|nr:RAQPRD family integrative conjugative element protein [Ectothiorhodospira haloalkaliphila]AHK80117.1 conjugal transfer protein [Ectothiorhodospira haloalkaliphila]
MQFTPILIILSLALPAHAGAVSPDAERAHLAQLASELASLESLIDEAERHADPDARIRFQYLWLRQDLDRVKQGIREHLQAPRAEPRQVPPLRGDYRR